MNLTIDNLQIPSKKYKIIKKNKTQTRSSVQFDISKKTPSFLNSFQTNSSSFINKQSFIESYNMPDISNVYTYRLSNGHKLTIVPKKGVFELNTFIDTGIQENSVLSHFVEHLLSNSNNLFEKVTFKKKN